MKSALVVVNDVVENVIVVGETMPDLDLPGAELIEVTGPEWIGWRRDGASWIPPEADPEPDPEA